LAFPEMGGSMRQKSFILAAGLGAVLCIGSVEAQPFISFPDADVESGPGRGIRGADITVNRGDGGTVSVRTRDDDRVMSVEVSPQGRSTGPEQGDPSGTSPAAQE
jgi:hypothetical protein